MLFRSLSSPIRLEILQLIYEEGMIIGEIAKKLGIPASSAAFHLKILEESDLVRIEELPGTRGGMKLCTRKIDHITIDLVRKNTNVNEVFSMEMPVGAYSSFQVMPTCGLCTKEGIIGNEDIEYFFYAPERFKAGMLWTSSGYVEYQFANGVPEDKKARRITVSVELCSEAPGYREDWKSDITMWINGKDCGTFTSPGDFGQRRGRLTPPSVINGSSQYGLQTVWEVRDDGSYINNERVAEVSVNEIGLEKNACITVRIGNKPDAVYVGGFNLFGKNFGDYNQDIILNIEYC